MFGFLKDKLKGIVSKFSKKIDEEAKTIEEAPREEPKPRIEEPKEIPKAEPQQKPKLEEKKQEIKLEPKLAPKPEPRHEHKAEPKVEEKRHEPKSDGMPEPKPAPKEEPAKEEPTLMKMPEQEKHSFFDFLKKHTKKEEEEPKKEVPAEKPAEKHKEAPKEEHRPKPEEHKPEEKRQEAKPEPRHEQKPEPKQEPKPEYKPEPRPEPKPESIIAHKKESVDEPKTVSQEISKEAPKNIFSILKEKITKKELSEQQFEEMFWDLEMILLENNVAVEVIDKIKRDLKESLVNKPLERNRLDEIIESTLKRTIKGLFEVEGVDLIKRAKAKKPFIICFVGINGSGKTTSIAKVAHLLKKNGLTSVMAASDTFRAAAIQQLEEHANRLNIKLIKHDYGADSAAVAFDAISYAKAHNIDVVLIDTAGRLQSNTNLMDELKKVKRITKPDLILFVGESITGNDCVEQAKTFDTEIGIDGIILSKSDIDEKGGAAISISYITRKPIMYLGTGQGYEDLIEFDPKIIIDSLGLEG